MSEKKKKSKTPAIVINTEDGLAASVNRYVDLQLRLKEAKAIHDQNVASLNAEFDSQTSDMVMEIESLITGCQLYCDRNRVLFPEGSKSRSYRNATVGFRLNPPKVDKILAKDTWEAIAARLNAVEWGKPFLHFKDPTVNKDALLANRANLTTEQLQLVGVSFAQGETFFIEPAFEGAPAVAVSLPAQAA